AGAKVWDAKADEILPVPAGEVVLSRDGKWLAIRTSDGVVLWDTKKRQQALTLEAAPAAPAALDFDAKGKTLVGVAADGQLFTWELKKGKLKGKSKQLEATGTYYL